ncbi:hypothetical protein H312_01490 [Anncaliia algerae PRA339]|uniref:Uncharacterized protein n=1 Tax=Anncaliia algerae PRA339 TaxID=1288291 RepID=A0A059F2A4_9MICR|nr:hypothetical protein H312_01490 [Anncaliia algerae PRA339]
MYSIKHNASDLLRGNLPRCDSVLKFNSVSSIPTKLSNPLNLIGFYKLNFLQFDSCEAFLCLCCVTAFFRFNASHQQFLQWK